MTIQLCSSEHLFVTGSVVEVFTVHKEVITGEVFSFDYDSRLLILKVNKPKTSNKPNNHNITILNLAFCSEIKSVSTPEPEVGKAENISTKLNDIDFKKLDARVEKAIEERDTITRHFKNSSGIDGVLLYYQLDKTFSGNVKWNADQIIVQSNVAIKPPYKPDSVMACNPKEKLSEDSIAYIRSIVEKFWQTNDNKALPGKAGKKNKT